MCARFTEEADGLTARMHVTSPFKAHTGQYRRWQVRNGNELGEDINYSLCYARKLSKSIVPPIRNPCQKPPFVILRKSMRPALPSRTNDGAFQVRPTVRVTTKSNLRVVICRVTEDLPSLSGNLTAAAKQSHSTAQQRGHDFVPSLACQNVAISGNHAHGRTAR